MRGIARRHRESPSGKKPQVPPRALGLELGPPEGGHQFGISIKAVSAKHKNWAVGKDTAPHGCSTKSDYCPFQKPATTGLHGIDFCSRCVLNGMVAAGAVAFLAERRPEPRRVPGRRDAETFGDVPEDFRQV